MAFLNVRYDTVIFDLDGTLVNTEEGIVNSVLYALEKFNIKEENQKKLLAFIGPPLFESFEKYYGFDEKTALKAVEYYREYYRIKGIDENTLYVGIRELLEKIKLSGRKIILATSKPEQFAIHILKSHNILMYFDFIAGASMDSSRVAKVDVMNYALSKAGVTLPSKAIMVGDRKYDVLGAKNFNIQCIGLTYGFGSKEELESAGAVCLSETPKDIFECL